jgi:hypothetical protein
MYQITKTYNLGNNIAAPVMYSNFSSKVQTYQNDLQAYAMNDESLIYF